MATIDTDRVLRGYLACALWCATDGENGEIQLDETHTVEDFAADAVSASRDDVTAFCEDNADDLALYADVFFQHDVADAIGHDLYLTRNHHGTGFWDRSYDPADVAFLARLTEAAHVYGSADVYVADDGTLAIA